MTRSQNFFLILILGILCTISPFAIDLYLPAFPQLAAEFHTTPAKIAFSLSSYFVGLSIGQLVYGPLLDRFGRKRPLYAGLIIFILASYGCLRSTSVEMLIGFRFLQALGACVASVAPTAMVMDFFPPEQGAKVFSLLMLVLSVSPMFAPTVGSFVTVTLGWKWVFILLAAIVFVILIVVYFFLPDKHKPDPTISLRPIPIAKIFWQILRDPVFFTYAFSGALAFCGLFVHVASSPIVFMEIFRVSAGTYGGIFAFLAAGLIGAGQLNILLVRRFSPQTIYLYALIGQAVMGVIFLLAVALFPPSLPLTVGLLFLLLSNVGLSLPNSSVLALAPFTKTAGSASALLGFLQIGAGAVASGLLGLINATTLLPIVLLFAGSGGLALLLLLFGSRGVPPLSRPNATHLTH